MLTTHPFDDDTLHEECGIFGVSGSDGAAALVALGLHALQHRGQEAAGITSFDGANFHYPSRDGACRRQFRSRRRHPRAAGHRRVGACPLFDDGRDRAAQRPAAVCRSVDRRLRGRAQRQHLERDEAAARPRPPRLDLPVDQRYRDDHPPRRDLELPYVDGPFHRCAEADRGGVFADRDDSGRDDRMPRSARHPATRHGTAPTMR